MFRKAHLHLTLFYSIFFFVLLWSFSVAIYVWMEHSFGETYISRVKDLDTVQSGDTSDAEAPAVGYSNTVAIAGDVALQQLRNVLATSNLLFLFLIPPIAWALAYRTLKPIRRSHEQQQQFVSDASHELRTPLSVLLGETELALNKNRSPQELTSVLMSVKEEVKYLQSLVENLLMLSRLDQEQDVTGITSVDLTDILAIVMTRCLPLAHQKNQQLSFTPPQDQIMLRGNEVLLLHLFQNLIENAIKYTQIRGKVRVRLSLQSGAAVVTVQDNGRGIPQEFQTKIFQRFYQVDTSRSGKKGHGLGLALCQSIVRAHHGTLTVTSQNQKGTTFVVTLPLRG